MAEILKHSVVERDEFVTATEINGKATNLKVELSKNGNKGLISIAIKISNDQITGISAEDQGTMAQLSAIALKAIQEGVKWQKEWHKNNSNGQLDLFDFNGPGSSDENDNPEEENENPEPEQEAAPIKGKRSKKLEVV